MRKTDIEQMNLNELLKNDGFMCKCGKRHASGIDEIIIEKGALLKAPELVKKYGALKPFIISDVNTFKAAGNTVCCLLSENNITYTSYVFPQTHLVPDEFAVGSAVMHFDHSCDMIIGVGSGVINDIGKILSRTTGKPYIIVCTAPSMDGYASASSSMEMDGLKTSLDSTSANAIVADLDVLCNAPTRMIQSGIGDMIAKYISICEWKISHIITGEYYCDTVASLVINALQKCIDSVDSLKVREPEAVKAVIEGMVIAGMAMQYAGLSRPASGIEHYYSHIWDMRGLEFKTPVDLHGIQCGIATLLSLKVYDEVRKIKPDREKALNFVSGFSLDDWNNQLKLFLGKSANSMINGEKVQGKYDKQKHAKRLEIIADKWEEVLSVINELPSYEQVESVLKTIDAPTVPAEIGITDTEVHNTFLMTKDIRDKYIVSRLLWDIGKLNEIADKVFPKK